MRFPRCFIVLSGLLLASCTLQPPMLRENTTSSRGSSTGISSQTSQEEIEGEVTTDTPATATGSDVTVIPERILAGGMLEIGNAEAPVSLLIVTNHACSWCQQFHREHEQRLIADFVRAGQLRITVLPFALAKYGASKENASALLCAAQQGRGQPMNGVLFSVGNRGFSYALRDSGEASSAFDMEKLTACMNDPRTAEMLAAQQSFAHAMNISLLPAIILDGDLSVGLPEYADLRGMIEQRLAQ